jgi:hypothetical protein
LNAPNVLAKKTIIPGQVDYGWVVDKVRKWCVPIEASQARLSDGDFEFEGQWYHPNDLFMVKVQGEFPREAEDKLIPLSWIEAAQERWKEIVGRGAWGVGREEYGSKVIKEQLKIDEALRLGVDVAGMGRDMTVFCYRYGNFIAGFQSFAKADHMETAGRIKAELEFDKRSQALIDTIGEGAGVHSRLYEQELRATSVKFSESAKDYSDYTLIRKFANMRAYCWWAIRDALDPKFDTLLALPPNDELTQDLNEPTYKLRSDGAILIEEKDDIKQRLGRSPDYGDALAISFYPSYFSDEEISWGFEPR